MIEVLWSIKFKTAEHTHDCTRCKPILRDQQMNNETCEYDKNIKICATFQKNYITISTCVTYVIQL